MSVPSPSRHHQHSPFASLEVTNARWSLHVVSNAFNCCYPCRRVTLPGSDIGEVNSVVARTCTLGFFVVLVLLEKFAEGWVMHEISKTFVQTRVGIVIRHVLPFEAIVGIKAHVERMDIPGERSQKLQR